jgi:Fibronectin type III domain
MSPSGRRIALVGTAALSLLLGPAAAATAGTATADAIAVASVSPDSLGASTVTPIHIIGSGMTADDTIVDVNQPTRVVFSQLSSDGDGGLDALVRVTNASVRDDEIDVESADHQQTSRCIGCLHTAVTSNEAAIETDRPGPTSLFVQWAADPAATSYVVTWTAPGGPTTSQTATGTSTTISGLQPATPYVVTVAGQHVDGAHTIVGQDNAVTEEVGVVPDPPTLTGSSPCCGVDVVEAAGQTWQLGGVTYTFTFTPRGGGTPLVETVDSVHQFIQDFDPRGTTVTATATNNVGTSAASQPILIRPVVPATAVRHETYRYAQGRLILTWRPPANTGNSAIRHYQVDVSHGSKKFSATTTGLTVSLPMSAGTAFSADVRAVTEAGPGFPVAGDSGGTAYLDVVTALDRHGRAQWRYDDQGGWHSLGGHFAAPPAPFVRPGNSLTFVGADTSGHAMIRTLGTPWRSLTATPCFQPVAMHSAMGMTVACRAANGTLEFSVRTPNHHGLPFVRPADWTTSTLHIVGGPQAAGGRTSAGMLVVRTAAWNKAGDDVRTYDTGSADIPPHFGKIALACTGPVAISQQVLGVVGCRTGSHAFSWQDRGSTTSHGTVTTPYRIAGSVAMTSSADGLDARAALTDAHGRIHVIDVLQQGLTWTLGESAVPGLRGTCVKGCNQLPPTAAAAGVPAPTSR